MEELLGEVRHLSAIYRAGENESFEAFRKLVQLLLANTVCANTVFPTVFRGEQDNVRTLGGTRKPGEPIRLRNDRFLQLSVVLARRRNAEGVWRLQVAESGYKYQLTPDGDSWIFRYDYHRVRSDVHPRGHVHLNGDLKASDGLDGARYDTLERVHFPTGRVSLEAVVRLLVEQFGVSTNPSCPEWRRLLAESEQLFHDVAQVPPSGPAT